MVQLDEIDWKAVGASDWRDLKEKKQAEFLLEQSFPWSLALRVGVHSAKVGKQAHSAMRATAHQPTVKIKADRYY